MGSYIGSLGLHNLNACAIEYRISVIVILVPSCHLPNVYVNVTALAASTPVPTFFHVIVLASNVVALDGTANLPLGPLVTTVKLALTGIYSPVCG